jgi:hypothetical protein
MVSGVKLNSPSHQEQSGDQLFHASHTPTQEDGTREGRTTPNQIMELSFLSETGASLTHPKVKPAKSQARERPEP